MCAVVKALYSKSYLYHNVDMLHVRVFMYIVYVYYAYTPTWHCGSHVMSLFPTSLPLSPPPSLFPTSLPLSPPPSLLPTSLPLSLLPLPLLPTSLPPDMTVMTSKSCQTEGCVLTQSMMFSGVSVPPLILPSLKGVL